MRQRMITVLRPSFNPHPSGYRGERVTPRLQDYITLPWIDTIATWRARDIMKPENVAKLAILANKMEKTSKR